MTQTLAAEQVTLEQLITLYGLELVDGEEFFPDWQDDLPELTDLEKQLLDQIKAGYINLRNYPPLLENTVNTDVLNQPMIKAFQGVGYRQFGSPWQRPL